MKKYIPYLVIILLLGGAAGWFIYHKTRGIGSLDEKALAIESAADITKVVLTCSDKSWIELTRPKDTWMVDGKYPARDDLIANLFGILTKIRVLCPVPYAAHDNVIKQMMGYNIKVEIYTGKGDAPARTYYIGGPTPDQHGTYALYEEDGKISDRPYITYIPNYRGFLTPNFNTDEEVWRSRVLFNYQPDSIKSISVEYPGEEENSFTINRIAGDSFDLQPAGSKFVKQGEYQQKYIRQYLGFFSPIYIEAYDNSYRSKDSMLSTVPYCVISVTGKDNGVNKARLFHMPLNRRSKSQFDKKGELMKYDVDRYYAAINNDKDFAVVQYYVFGKLMRKYSDFFYQPGTAKP